MINSKLLTVTGGGYQLNLMAAKLSSSDPAEQSILAGTGFPADSPLILVCLLQPGTILSAYDPFAWRNGAQQEMMRVIHLYIVENYEALVSGQQLTYHQQQDGILIRR